MSDQTHLAQKDEGSDTVLEVLQKKSPPLPRKRRPDQADGVHKLRDALPGVER